MKRVRITMVISMLTSVGCMPVRAAQQEQQEQEERKEAGIIVAGDEQLAHAIALEQEHEAIDYLREVAPKKTKLLDYLRRRVPRRTKRRGYFREVTDEDLSSLVPLMADYDRDPWLDTSLKPSLKVESQELKGHTRGLSSVAISPNRQYIVTGSLDGTARLWGRDGVPLYTLPGEDTDAIRSVAISPNGEFLITVSREIRVWDIDAKAGRLLMSKALGNDVYVATISPNSQRIVASSMNNGTVSVWNRDGELLHELHSDDSRINALAVSPDSQLLVTGSSNGIGRIWNLQTGSLIAELTGHTLQITSAAISKNGNFIVTGSRDKTARLWDAATGRLIRILSQNGEDKQPIDLVAISPDSQRVVTNSDSDENIKIWDANTGILLHTLRGHTSAITSMEISPDGLFLVTGSVDDTARIWDMHTGALAHTLSGHEDMVTAVAISPDMEYIVTGSYDGTARIWRLVYPDQAISVRQQEGDE